MFYHASITDLVKPIYYTQFMKLDFLKYEGAGNDFILIDNRNETFSLVDDTETIKKLCDRHFGIGADGLMVLQMKNGFDFEMLYFNADGREGSMCGNGGRCIVAFANHLKVIEGETNFLAVDGPHYATISENGNWVSLQMIDVQDIKTDGDAFVLNTGSPHYVLEVEDLASKDVYQDGKTIRYNETYSAKGINVNFVEDLGDHYFVRTYERGVENETFACGTGVTAVSMAMAKKKGLTGRIKNSIRVPGGNLNVNFNYDGNSFNNVFLEGPATFVFEGSINI
ncbi:diaminopimelate epimerase [Daejeonella rubra]|uniref:Diaminopimelate epimerase n=2 Tax=Daejeonella rubra TaxID=990371 RepID=A0A1G9YGU4_9SPHI|nr:diaminopimelate epimerase [Daejeonella rubra]